MSCSPCRRRWPHASADGGSRTSRHRYNPHSRARHPAGSLNPASMRSRSRLRPTPVPRDLTEASRFPRGVVSDSRCWLGLGASIDGETLFTGFTRAGCSVCGGRAFVPRHGGDLRGERGLRGEVVSALSGERQRGGLPDGRASPAIIGRRAGLAVGAARREARPDLAGGGGRAGGARHHRELRCGVAVFRAGRDHLQKKACTPANRTVPTSPGGAPGGRSIRAGLTPSAWSSSTRPGPRPI
jgi:hypothetical protein